MVEHGNVPHEHTQNLLDRLLNARYSRGGFLRLLTLALSALLFSSKNARSALAATGEKLQPRKRRTVTTACDIAVARGNDPAALARKAVEALGGMGTFVKKGDVVVVKPNMGWDRTPEQAANTNPEVVRALVEMCFESGAKIVKVFDNTCNSEKMTYRSSGVHDAAKKAGATVFFVNDWKFIPAQFPDGAAMEDYPLFRDAVMCDCFINVPIAKHHSLTGLTLSMKNLMGICGGSRGTMHWNVSKKLVEVTAFMKPDLTVIDAYRILLRHGPSGGDLEDVALKKTVIASADPVMADAYAATLFNKKPEDIEHIKLAHDTGIGNMNYKRARMKEIAV